MNENDHDKLLTPGEVASRFRVDPKTVTRWARAGKLPCTKTPGGHRRYPEEFVDQLVARGYQAAREDLS